MQRNGEYVMAVPVIESVKVIEHQYPTGEEPVLVMCSDMNAYICKYMRSSASAFKLACELIGSKMAMAWLIETPAISFVRIKSDHWMGRYVQHSISAPALGSKRIEGVVDVTSSTCDDINSSTQLLRQLIKIALFDFWIANEDRNVNNANLLYDLVNDKLISIDYGCIFNTATYDYTITQLTSNESILCSDLFQHLVKNKEIPNLEIVLRDLKKEFYDCLKRSQGQMKQIVDEMPKEWNVPLYLINNKLHELFDEQWTTGVWNNFVECLNDNVNHE